jgi:hypothetical protein
MGNCPIKLIDLFDATVVSVVNIITALMLKWKIILKNGKSVEGYIKSSICNN